MIKNCRQCGTSFEITSDDLAFHERVSPVFNDKKELIPPPTLCPDCRLQNRMVWRAELHVFQRKSDLSGESMLSYFPPGADCKVYSVREWWSDAWNPLEYGRDVDFSHPFFDQVSELIRTVPLLGLSVMSNENSDYINCASWCKNCYLIAGANHDEDCYYGNYVNNSTSCVDCSFVDHCELCYECVDCSKCYNLQHSTNCHNCSDSYFLSDCAGCHHCFGSVNLRNKEYVFMNEQLTKADYEARCAGLRLDRRSRRREAEKFFAEHRLKYPHRFMIGEMNENVTGNCMLNCRNTFESFDVSKLEDCARCIWFHHARDCRDCFAWGFPAEECYGNIETGANAHRIALSAVVYNSSDCLYCYSCQAIDHCFGCVSLRNGKYCILNKQYTKEEYEVLVPKVIGYMRSMGEWGEFFPVSICPLAYNQTVAQDYFPLSKEQAEGLGARWYDEPGAPMRTRKISLSETIAEVGDDICEKILLCTTTGKPYKIIPQELRFYREHNIPLPEESFPERHKRRLAMRNPRRLWDRMCDKCKKSIRTSYDPKRPEIVYCEECYLKEVY